MVTKEIQALQSALEGIGVSTELITDARWYGIDHKIHYGIELVTSIDTGEDSLSFLFTPDGRYIHYCTEAPTLSTRKKKERK